MEEFFVVGNQLGGVRIAIPSKERRMTMSEKQEKKRRYNQKLEYIAHVEKWLKQEPPMLNFIAWVKWKKSFPKFETIDVEWKP